MKAKSPLMASAGALRGGNLVIKLKRGGWGATGGAGPTGYKAKPSRLLQRAMADRVGVNLAVKRRQEEIVAAKARAPRPWGGFWGLDKDGNKTGVAA